MEAETQSGAWDVQAEKASASPVRVCAVGNDPCFRSHEAEKHYGRRACEEAEKYCDDEAGCVCDIYK